MGCTKLPENKVTKDGAGKHAGNDMKPSSVQ